MKFLSCSLTLLATFIVIANADLIGDQDSCSDWSCAKKQFCCDDGICIHGECRFYLENSVDESNANADLIESEGGCSNKYCRRNGQTCCAGLQCSHGRCVDGSEAIGLRGAAIVIQEALNE